MRLTGRRGSETFGRGLRYSPVRYCADQSALSSCTASSMMQQQIYLRGTHADKSISDYINFKGREPKKGNVTERQTCQFTEPL